MTSPTKIKDGATPRLWTAQIPDDIDRKVQARRPNAPIELLIDFDDDGDGEEHCVVRGVNAEANANLIVLAVNSRDDLLAACKSALDLLESGSGDLDEQQRHERRVQAQLEDAITKAEGP